MGLVTVQTIVNQLDNYEPVMPEEICLGKFGEDEYLDVYIGDQKIHRLGETFDNDFMLRIVVYSHNAQWTNNTKIEQDLLVSAKNMTPTYRCFRAMENWEFEAKVTTSIKIKKAYNGQTIFECLAVSGSGCNLVDVYVMGTDQDTIY